MFEAAGRKGTRSHGNVISNTYIGTGLICRSCIVSSQSPPDTRHDRPNICHSPAKHILRTQMPCDTGKLPDQVSLTDIRRGPAVRRVWTVIWADCRACHRYCLSRNTRGPFQRLTTCLSATQVRGVGKLLRCAFKPMYTEEFPCWAHINEVFDAALLSPHVVSSS